MAHFNYRDFFPINDSASLKEGKYKDLTKNEIKKWRNFNNITKSDFIYDKLAEEQNNICPACYKIIGKSDGVIHHLDYERLCKYLECHKVLKPTPKQPYRKIKVPKCSKCTETNICEKKVVLIHNKCHFQIHIIEGRIKRPKNKNITKKNTKTEEEKLDFWKNSLTKNHKEIIQRTINLIRKTNPEKEFQLKYYSRYISLKPSNSVTFKTNENDTVIRLKKGNLIEIYNVLNERNIYSEKYYRKEKLHSIAFFIDLNQFNTNIELIENILKYCN